MSLARGHSIKHRLCQGLAISLACLGCASSKASGSGPSGISGTTPGGNASDDAGLGGTSSGGISSTAGANTARAGTGVAGDGMSGSSGAHATGGSPAGVGGSGAGGAPAGAGGVPASSGATGHGGTRSCDLLECFVANTCLDKCGGSVVYTGCCACEPPAVDQKTCTGMN